MRVDRFLSNLPRYNRKQARLLLVEKRVRIDGKVVSDPHSEVLEFSRVEVDDEVLQSGKPARYFMKASQMLVSTRIYRCIADIPIHP